MNTKKRKIVSANMAPACYFRTSVKPPYRKALLQITERCNLHCAHCFVSAGNYGEIMSFGAIRDIVVPKLKECRVISVTLTGGEPFIHPDIIEIVNLLKNNNIKVSICTNGVSISQDQIEILSKIGDIHLNVSLDGFRAQSHGKFRGVESSFKETIKNIRLLSQKRLLHGLLVTPNNFAKTEEYAEICEFAIQNRAVYVLMNPLSNMGRGARVQKALGASNKVMRQIKDITFPFSDRIQILYVRFPNDQKFPLISCEAGNIIYVFASGEVAICPYLVFASRISRDRRESEKFIVGNIFKDVDMAKKMDEYKFYERYHLGNNKICKNCVLNFQCGKGCPAAVIASGQRIDGIDPMCPMSNIKF